MIPYRQGVKADVFEASIARSIRATETKGSLLPNRCEVHVFTFVSLTFSHVDTSCHLLWYPRASFVLYPTSNFSPGYSRASIFFKFHIYII